MENNYCTNCKVSVSADLKYCPLCGKFVLKSEEDKPAELPNSFPKYDFSYIYKQKWLKLVSRILFLLALISAAVNFVFLTRPMWFPYAWLGLILLYVSAFYPLKEDRNHIVCLPTIGVWVAFGLMFLDVYNHLTMGTTFGWAVFVVSPCVLMATMIISCILSLCLGRSGGSLFRGMLWLLFLAIVLFVLKVTIFEDYINWPIWMNLFASTIAFFVPILFKRRRVSSEFNKNFHI